MVARQLPLLAAARVMIKVQALLPSDRCASETISRCPGIRTARHQESGKVETHKTQRIYTLEPINS